MLHKIKGTGRGDSDAIGRDAIADYFFNRTIRGGVDRPAITVGGDVVLIEGWLQCNDPDEFTELGAYLLVFRGKRISTVYEYDAQFCEDADRFCEDRWDLCPNNVSSDGEAGADALRALAAAVNGKERSQLEALFASDAVFSGRASNAEGFVQNVFGLNFSYDVGAIAGSGGLGFARWTLREESSRWHLLTVVRVADGRIVHLTEYGSANLAASGATIRDANG